mgnify:CR=1 FL=1
MIQQCPNPKCESTMIHKYSMTLNYKCLKCRRLFGFDVDRDVDKAFAFLFGEE